ncbi:dihydroxy-acid dehydratase [Alicyclobacillus tolerans]|uniref:dihydroxy-acid dehydratase n=1 Tax=Alicyclobacillus tolerans TaxID=90970 RepID=UPI001F4270A6|nr:dihydroxy-acid dehydratase [Alicyclobacillus tolerans]MCF8565721.1 dihydroxy-acid dehydratase [Alicyclobacillus tolerans]
MNSQLTRKISFEGDALRLSMDWDVEDLSRPQVLVETTQGQSHPSSYHLGDLANEIAKGVWQANGKPAHYTATDICDGVAQAHHGMRYSLLSRELIVGLIEAHQKSTPFDGVVLSSSGDKAVPAPLIALARMNVPGIHVPGGAMASGPNQHTNDELWHLSVDVAEGRMKEEDFLSFQQTVCPSCGACQYMGTAGTMQVMSEALGLALPSAALIPATMSELRRSARMAGKQIMSLIAKDIRPRTLLTREAFENAIVIHAAINGSLNAIMHLIAIAQECGVELTPQDFDRIHRQIPVLVDTKSSGRFSTELFWYAGGVPRLMTLLEQYLHLDVLTVTGNSLYHNLEVWNRSPLQRFVTRFLDNYHLKPADIIHGLKDPLSPTGSVAILFGNIAPGGAAAKMSAIVPEMQHHIGPAKVFDTENAAVEAIRNRTIDPGDVLVIRYQGPRSTGMPEMFYPSELIASDPVLSRTTALVTDGRFSGATKGPCIGYINPEAADNGPIAAIQDGDLIRIDIPNRRLDLILEDGVTQATEEFLHSRIESKAGPVQPEHTGILGLYTSMASPAMSGGMMRVTHSL